MGPGKYQVGQVERRETCQNRRRRLQTTSGDCIAHTAHTTTPVACGNYGGLSLRSVTRPTRSCFAWTRSSYRSRLAATDAKPRGIPCRGEPRPTTEMCIRDSALRRGLLCNRPGPTLWCCRSQLAGTLIPPTPESCPGKPGPTKDTHTMRACPGTPHPRHASVVGEVSPGGLSATHA